MSRSKYDNEFKEQVINNGIVKDTIAIKKGMYKNARKGIDCEGVVHDINDWAVFSAIERGNSQEFDCSLLLIESKRRKAQKVREKISNIVLNNNAVFLTLTFTDSVLSNTTTKTRRRYVARFLKSVSGEYVANIDFSPDIGREHYHAVVCNRVDMSLWSYGFAYAEQVRAHDRDLTRLSKYITKLTSHALKVDATRLIYSRL